MEKSCSAGAGGHEGLPAVAVEENEALSQDKDLELQLQAMSMHELVFDLAKGDRSEAVGCAKGKADNIPDESSINCLDSDQFLALPLCEGHPADARQRKGGHSEFDHTLEQDDLDSVEDKDEEGLPGYRVHLHDNPPEEGHPIVQSGATSHLPQLTLVETSEGVALPPSLSRGHPHVPPSVPGAFAHTPAWAYSDGISNSIDGDSASVEDGTAEWVTHRSLAVGTESETLDGLVEAQLVDEVNQPTHSTLDLQHARPLKRGGSLTPDAAQRGSLRMLALGLVLLAAVLVVLWLGFAFDPSSSKREDVTQVPKNDTGPLSPGDYLKLFLPPDTLANVDRNTSQSLAFQWLVRDPILTLYSERQLKLRFALATFYFATTIDGTAHWTNERHWLSYDRHECEWIQESRKDIVVGEISEDSACDNYIQARNGTSAVSSDGYHFVRLWLKDNTLQGTIPTEFYWLTDIKSIDLSSNKGLGGTLSPMIGKLTHLEFFSVRFNPLLTGVIPSQMAFLTNLTQLFFRGASLHGSIPTELLKQLTNLKQMSFSANCTGSIPSQIGLLTKLEALTIVQTGLRGTLPTEIGNLKSLKYTAISGNSFSGAIPSEIGSMSTLAWLYLGENSLTSTIPEALYQWSGLQELDLHGNQLTGSVSPLVGRMTRLYHTNLGFNQLSGSLPTEISNITGMSYLNLERNLFNGPLPSEIGDLVDLKTLALANCRFTGTIPSSFGHCRSLEEARWNSNLLTGAIPSQLGLLNGSLSIWDISNNQFSGSLPMDLFTWLGNSTGALKSLSLFNISANEGLMGTIPTDLCARLNSSSLVFDCSGILCGCDCRCQNDSRVGDSP